MPRKRRSSAQTLTLLAVLAEQPRKWRHGYDISTQTGLKSGTLYPILMRLCDRKFLESDWEESPEPGRPARHIYRLTPKGLAMAREQLKDAEATDQYPKGALGSRA